MNIGIKIEDIAIAVGRTSKKKRVCALHVSRNFRIFELWNAYPKVPHFKVTKLIAVIFEILKLHNFIV